jgi:hypothetical protein
MEARGTSIISTSGVLVTLLLGFATLVTKANDYKLPTSANWLLIGAGCLFVVAAVFGIAANSPIPYVRTEPESLVELIAPTEWQLDGSEADRQLTHARLKELMDARIRNGFKAWLVVVGLCFEILATFCMLIPIAVVLVER